MAEELKAIANLANSLTVVAILVIDGYLLVVGKVHTAKHTEDVVTALKGGHAAEVEALRTRNTDLAQERDRAVQREEVARRELAENSAMLGRLETTVRGALDALARRR